MSKIAPYLRILLALPLLFCTADFLPAQTEVYSWMFKNGDDKWNSLAVSPANENGGKAFIGWMPSSPNDSTGKGMLFSGSHAGTGEFLCIYKAFGGLRSNSLYRIATISSFTLAGTDSVPAGRLHLKAGGSPLQPKIASGRPNFSKGRNGESGRDMRLIGDIHTGSGADARRYFAQNYDAPAIVRTNHTGTLFLIIGIETDAETYMPDVYLNTLRILFDYVGKDSALSARDFRIDLTETDRPNVFSFKIVPDEDVLRYNIYTQEGHLVLVEEDTDCLPSCPNLIDASLLAPNDYLIEFVLPNERKIVRRLPIHP